MLADAQLRVPWLRSLSITGYAFKTNASWIPEPEVPFRAFLAEVLSQAHNLRHLHIEFLENLLDSEPGVSLAIPPCRHLSSLMFTSMWDKSREIISRLQNLRNVDFQGLDDISTVLKPFQSTLEAVKVTGSHHGVIMLAFNGIDQWPRAHTLKMGVISTSISTSPLSYAFPNLQVLRLLPGGYLNEDDQYVQ